MQRVVDQPVALDRALALEGVGNDFDNKVTAAAGAGVRRVRGALVDDIQRRRGQRLGEAVADQGDTIGFHQGSTFLKGFTTTWLYTPALT